jgi:aryl-alcohol dehydrogenase-like predicted oxidoreductase
MEYVNLGATGLKVSRLCLGCMTYGDKSWREWMLDEAASRPFFQQALDAGITFFDTADVYSSGPSEEVTGRLLGKIFPRRDDYVLATKVFFPMGDGPNDGGLSRKHIHAAIDASLRRLGTDHVDLYQIHRWDDQTPIEETMQALHEVVRAGKARYIGASSMAAWQFAKAQHAAGASGWTPFVSMQNHYNLIYREEEREMIPLCRDQGVGVIPWSPLARGLIARAGTAEAATARASGDDADRREELYGRGDERILQRVAQVADECGLPPARVGLAWLLSKPGVTAPVVGATRERHVHDAVAAVDVRLTDKQIEYLEEPYQPQAVRM